VWEVPICLEGVAQVRDIFELSIRQPLAQLSSSEEGRRRHALRTETGHFFVMRPPGWGSDICWVSCDDAQTLDRFEAIFRRLQLPEAFGPVIQQSDQIRMYSAFYVVRSKCSRLKLHCDYVREAGINALTLITPLDGYDPSQFQLTYARTGRPSDVSDLDCLPPESSFDRYVYRPGRAIIFGSGFWHSTELGEALDDPNVYLCFTFGTDKLSEWKAIAETIGTYQSRIIRLPNGDLGLTQLGEYLEREEPDWV